MLGDQFTSRTRGLDKVVFEFVANVAPNGEIIDLDGDPWALLKQTGKQILKTAFLDYVSDQDQPFVSEMLFDVRPNQDPVRFDATMMDSSGREWPTTMFAAPVFDGSFFNFTRVAIKRVDPLAINAISDAEAFNEVMVGFEQKLQSAIESDAASTMSIFSVESGDPLDGSKAGDRLHTMLEEKSDPDSQVCRISETSAAVLHDEKADMAGMEESIANGMGGLGSVSTFSLELGDDSLDVESRLEMATGVLAAAAQPGVKLGSGTHKLSDAYDRTREAVTAAIADAKPGIGYFIHRGDAGTKVGVADVPELLRRWNGGGKQGGAMLQDIVRSHLEAVARAKPEGIPVCVPIHAASLMFLDKAEWDKFDLMVMPIGLKELDEDLQNDAAALLSSQYVMVDIGDLVYCPAILAGLISAEALSFLCVDMEKNSSLSESELDSFKKVYDFCSDRGIYVLITRVEPTRIKDLLERAEVVFLPDRYDDEDEAGG